MEWICFNQHFQQFRDDVLLMLENLGFKDDSASAAAAAGMQRRAIEKARAQRDAYESYLRETAGSASAGGGGSADELAKLADLRDQGLLSQAEFDAKKRELLSRV